MDSSVIEEIAKQLGMAVDQAGQFITEHLPEFAALKIVQATAPLWVLGIIAIISLAGFVVSFAVVRDIDNPCAFLFLATFLASSFAFVLWLILSLAAIIGWSNYPEAMLIDMALKAV